MNNLRQEIIEALIFRGARTATQLANRFEVKWGDMVGCLEELRREGQVATEGRPGDTICQRCEMEYEDSEPGDVCGRDNYCQGRLVDDCKWTFCGGPVSQALSVELQISNSK